MRMTRRDQGMRLARMRDAQRDHESYLHKMRDASPTLDVKADSAANLGLLALVAGLGALAAGWTAGRTGTTGFGSVQIPAGATVGAGLGALAVTGVIPKKYAPYAAGLGLGAFVASITMWGVGKGAQAQRNAGGAPAGVVMAGAPSSYIGCPPSAPVPAVVGYRPPAPPVPAHMLPLPRVGQGTLTESELQAMAHALPIR